MYFLLICCGGKSQPAERVFTFSGGFVSLLIAWAAVRMFI